MKIEQLSNNQVYHLSNQIVARTAFFSPYYKKRFLNKMEYYLSPYCEIIGHCFNIDEFQLIVKLKGRRVFMNEYRKQRKLRKKSYEKVPHSSYIFSQLMANLQSSMAIHFNRKEKRSGAIFASRYQKRIVKNVNEMNNWLALFRNTKPIRRYFRHWQAKQAKQANSVLNLRGFDGVKSRGDVLAASGVGVGSFSGGAYEVDSERIIELQGQFPKLLKTSFSRQNLLDYLEIRHQIRIL